MRTLASFVAVVVLGVFLAAPARAQAPTHPLDALTQAEHWVVYDVLRASGTHRRPGALRRRRTPRTAQG